MSTWNLVQKITGVDWTGLPFSELPDYNFGTSVDISENNIIGGAYNSSNTGYAHIFTKEQDVLNWNQPVQLSGENINDLFGISVGIDGDYAVVGASNVNGDGAAYVFYKNEGGDNSWGQVKKIYSKKRSEQFGYAVDISSNNIIVGAYNSGSVYIFNKDQGSPDNWGEVKELTPSDSSGASEHFGFSVAISGDYAIVGARYNDTNGNNTGSAYIFYKDEGGTDNWGEVKKLTAADTDEFGYSVGISGNNVIVGSHRYENHTGSAFIFSKDQGGTNNWGQVAQLFANDAAITDYFGVSVSISENYCIVGAIDNDDNATDSGSAYIFYKNEGGTNNWGQVTELNVTNPSQFDRFGDKVSIYNDNAIVGMKNEDDYGNNSGAIYVYNSPDWISAGSEGDPHIVTLLNEKYDYDHIGYSRYINTIDSNLIINCLIEKGPKFWKKKTYITYLYIYYKDSYIEIKTGFRGEKCKIIKSKINNDDITISEYDLDFNRKAKNLCFGCCKDVEECLIYYCKNPEYVSLIRNQITIKLEDFCIINITNVNEHNYNPAVISVNIKNIYNNIDNYQGLIVSKYWENRSKIKSFDTIKIL